MSTYERTKKVIEIQKQRGTLNAAAMRVKIETFYLNNQLTSDEYAELLKFIEE